MILFSVLRHIREIGLAAMFGCQLANCCHCTLSPPPDSSTTNQFFYIFFLLSFSLFSFFFLPTSPSLYRAVCRTILSPPSSIPGLFSTTRTVSPYCFLPSPNEPSKTNSSTSCLCQQLIDSPFFLFPFPFLFSFLELSALFLCAYGSILAYHVW